MSATVRDGSGYVAQKALPAVSKDRAAATSASPHRRVVTQGGVQVRLL